MKKHGWLTVLTLLILALGRTEAVRAEIIPPLGPGQQIGYPAVVLCDTLTLREKPNSSSGAIRTLRYGDLPIVAGADQPSGAKEENGFVYCVLGDSEDSPCGWINKDYIVINPAWYVTEKDTAVYAWNDTDAPKVALLGKGVRLPILKSEGDWCVVSLRGAAGWIKTGMPFTARFQQGVELTKAELITAKGRYISQSREELTWLNGAFAAAKPAAAAGCPFDARLILTFGDGSSVTVYPATDDCRVFRTPDGSCYEYGAEWAIEAEQGFHHIRVSDAFWSIFGTAKEDLYP